MAAHRQVMVVGHQYQGGLALLVQFKQQVDNFRAGLAVQIAGRLVGEQNSRPGHKRPRQGHPLLLAAGQLLGRML